MAKRVQGEKGEERIVAKSKPTLTLVTHASKCPGILRAPCHPDWKSTGRLAERENTIKMKRRVLKCGKKMQCLTRVRGDS